VPAPCPQVAENSPQMVRAESHLLPRPHSASGLGDLGLRQRETQILQPGSPAAPTVGKKAE
jgi:hypothetical protein